MHIYLFDSDALNLTLTTLCNNIYWLSTAQRKSFSSFSSIQHRVKNECNIKRASANETEFISSCWALPFLKFPFQLVTPVLFCHFLCCLRCMECTMRCPAPLHCLFGYFIIQNSWTNSFLCMQRWLRISVCLTKFPPEIDACFIKENGIREMYPKIYINIVHIVVHQHASGTYTFSLPLLYLFTRNAHQTCE